VVLTEAITADPPLGVGEILTIAKAKKEESGIPDAEVGGAAGPWGVGRGLWAVRGRAPRAG
jgi:hypothetical protein